MDRRAKRRRTAVNYAKMAAGDFDDDVRDASSEEEKQPRRQEPVSEDEEDGANGDGQEPGVEPVESPSLRRRRRKPTTARSVSLKLPEAVLEAKKESEKKDKREQERKEKARKEMEKEKEKERGREREREKPKNRRVLTSDSEEDAEFGLDNDRSEDFVPRRGKKGFVEDDDHLLDEEDEELDEAELEAVEESRTASRRKAEGEPMGFKALQSSAERNSNSSGRHSSASTPRALRQPMMGPVLSRSLSGGRSDSRMTYSSGGAMLKGAQGRLLKKIGFKAPLVTPSTAKAAGGGEVLRQKSLPKGVGPAGIQAETKPQLGSLSGKGLGKSFKESASARPWFSTPGMGKWDRKSTAILDDSELMTTPRTLPGPPPLPEEPEAAAAGSEDPAPPELSAPPELNGVANENQVEVRIDTSETNTHSVQEERVEEADDAAALRQESREENMQASGDSVKEDGEASEDGELADEKVLVSVRETREEVGMPGSSLPRFGLVSTGE